MFTDSVLFSTETINKIEEKLLNAKNIRYLVSMKSSYTPIHFTFVKEINIKTTWSSSPLYIYKLDSMTGGDVKVCSAQSTHFLEQYYDKNLSKLNILPESDRANKLKHNDNVNLVYGEPCAYEIDRLINDLGVTESDVFYDLGCGNGNVCATFLFGSKCKKAVGIEISDFRYSEAERIKNEIQTNHSDKMVGKELIYINDNFFNHNYDDATIVFSADLLFNTHVINKIEEKLLNSKNIRYLVSMKTNYEPIHFKLLKTIDIKTSWSSTILYIYVPK